MAGKLASANSHELVAGAKEKDALGYRGCREAHVAKRVCGQNGEGGFGRNDIYVSGFGGEVEIVASGNGRGSEGFGARTEPFAVVNFTGVKVDATEDAIPIAAKKHRTEKQGRLHIAAQLGKAPDNGVIGYLDRRR